ncbi:hypothetical protein [Kitasatospora cinereorecta]|uniref:Integral membrane protein n=1 Tax=Kitasatospora cinereorecta TaxID=285560 RepID=A0ABW0V869_9ACTN
MTVRTAALRTAIAAYPAHYRRDRGAELADVFADTTAGAGRLATAREALDLAAYGLRLRTRLTATTLGGRLLATAAPLLAGALLGVGPVPGLADPRTHTIRVAARAGLTPPWTDTPGHLAVLGLTVVPALLAAAAALGAWRAARVLACAVALLGALRIALAATDTQDSWLLLYAATVLMPYLAGGVLLLAAPPDLLDEPRRHSRPLLVGLGAAAGFAAVRVQGGYDTRYLMDGWWPLLLLLAPLLPAVLCAARGRIDAAAAGLALLPLTAAFSLFSLWQQAGGVLGLLPWAVAVALALTAAARLLAGRQPSPAAVGPLG